tara:strand:+ start:1695 stop:2279 length:585 start_codon:yes stop_codon:yes gene_type:complete
LIALVFRPYRLIFTIILPLAIFLNKIGLLSTTKLKLTFLKSILSGISNDRLNVITKLFIRIQLKTNIRKLALESILKHKKDGDILILASASFDFYVNSLAKELNFDHILSTKSSWSPKNKLLSKIDGENLKGDKKVDLITNSLNYNFNEENVICYSDHISDLPLFSFADQPYVVNPKSNMKKVAKRRGYTILHW